MPKSSNSLRWSEDEDRILHLHFPHENTNKVMERLPGRSMQSIRSRAYAFGLKKTKEQRKRYLDKNREHALTVLRGATPWNKKEHLSFDCEVCGSKFTVAPFRSKARFCSVKCRHESLKTELGLDHPLRGLAIVQCKLCGADMKARPSKIALGEGRLCSRQCLGSWIVSKQQRVSKIETCFGDYLAQSGFEIQRQVLLRHWTVDFLIGGVLVCEFDGAYWHQLPKVIERDKRKNRDIVSLGYQLVRVPENLFRQNPSDALQLVIDAAPSHCYAKPPQGKLF